MGAAWRPSSDPPPADTMCGVCGVVYSEPREVSRLLVRQMCDVIRHRGPDEDGYHFSPGAGLGMRRLSIIDLAHGSQPISNEDGTLVTILNGEIYNYRELRGELQGRGHNFRSDSDTEVIVHAYEEFGRDFVERLRGMFALGVFDVRSRRLTLALDRFGIKPLYYSQSDGALMFGSELKCLLATRLLNPDIDDAALAQYFGLGYIPPPFSIFETVRKLGPGHLLEWEPGQVAELSRYWEPPEVRARRPRNDATLRLEVRDALRDSVRAHMVSDVPVGAFLSGGVDSSTVVALMTETARAPVETFSIGFSDPRYNELPRARLVAERFATRHHEMIVEPDDVAALPELVRHFDEPFADGSALPTYHVSKLARRHVKVALSGDGGDELFVGYTLFRGLDMARHLDAMMPPAVLAALRRLPTGFLAAIGATRPAARRIERLLQDTLTSPAEAYRRKISAPGLGAVMPLLSDELRERMALVDPFAAANASLSRAARRASADPLDPFLYAGLQVSLPGDMLVKVDRMSMANSLEVRVPFLDHILADLVASLPVSTRFPRWRLKGLLKDVMADTLPGEILKGPKRGFNVPLDAWFRGDLTGFSREVLTDPSVRRSGFFDISAIERLLGASDRPRGALVWSLLMFALWHREYLTD